jgi:hypothetical protein
MDVHAVGEDMMLWPETEEQQSDDFSSSSLRWFAASRRQQQDQRHSYGHFLAASELVHNGKRPNNNKRSRVVR